VARYKGTIVFGRKSGKKKTERVEKKKPAARPKAKVRAVTPARKLPNNIYTMMLLLSFLAMLLATIMMWVELARYGGLGAWKT
jgi:hypothetical protein